MVCEADEQRDEGDLDSHEPKKGHGRCSHSNPQGGFLQYKKPKDEGEVCDRHAGLCCVLIGILGH